MLQKGIDKRNYPLVVSCVGLLALLTTCGLERYIYLYPISADFVRSDPTILYYEFRHNTENTLDEFLGYEIYYKFYAAGDDAGILADRRALEGVYLATVAPLTTRNFSRLRFAGVGQPPLIRITDRETAWVFRLDFSPLLETPKEPPVLRWFLADGTTPKKPPTILLREARAGGEDEETFVPNQILFNDPDISRMRLSSHVQNRGRLAIVFAVAAFGRSVDFTPIFSDVLFLNRSGFPETDVLVIDLQP